jgi:glycosyltransferase involved in cell wall biosynthesis
MPTATFDETTDQRSGDTMRILHLIKHCQHCNGNVNVAVDLACGQARKGHQVVYASAGGHYAKLLDAYGVRRAEIHQGQESSPFRLIGNLAALVRLCRSFKLDVIHAHMMSSAVFGFIASKLTGVPLVTTVHNSYDRHAVLMRAGRLVVAISKADRDLLVGRGFKPSKLVVILNGPIESPRENFGTPTGVVLAKPSITTVCGLHQHKGVQDLIAAFRLLLPDFPNWHFNIVGGGPDRAKLEALAAELGVAKSTHFIGPVEAAQPLLRQSNIFVLASHAEPGCLVIPEAREAGCAIVATEVGGMPEPLAHGDAGQMVEPEQPGQFAKVLRGLMQDPDSLRQWRARAKTGAEYFTVARVVDDYDKVYAAVKRA